MGTLVGKKRLALYAVLIIIAVCGICVFYLNMFNKSPTPPPFDRTTRSPDNQQPDKMLVHLYFADKENSFLLAEERVLFRADNPAEIGRSIITSLLHGPQGELMRTIPDETALRALYVTQDGTAYVDLAETIKEHHPGGSKSELMTIYSIVNSLILNIPEIDAVKILIGGRESMTLAGHVDLSSPFKADMLLIR